MKKIFLAIIILAIIGGGAYYFYKNKEKYFFKGRLETQDDKKQENGDSGENILDQSSSSSSSAPIDIPSSNVSGNDCSNNCKDKEGTTSYDYCREICGFNEGTSTQTGDCEALSGFEKDSCYKKKAVDEKNDNYCDKISDEKLKINCKNRVTEDLF